MMFRISFDPERFVCSRLAVSFQKNCPSKPLPFNSAFRTRKFPRVANYEVLADPKCRSLGDALKNVDRKFTVRNEFILLRSLVVSNAQLISQT
jgi:hypothetical protein